MHLPFVGLVTFAREPACPDWDKLDSADVAVLGVPIDTASNRRRFRRGFAAYDASVITSLLAARTSIDFVGSIFHERATRRA
jgi:hypothetical protein